MFVRRVRRLRRVLTTVLFLLLLAGSLVVTLALAQLSAAPAVRADLIPPPTCPKECPTTTAKRADGGGLPPICCPHHDASIPAKRADGLPPIPPVGPGLAQDTVAVVN